MNKKVFISTAIPYVNARPHIGFALELVQADTLARFYRETRGRQVLFLTGADENSLKNVQAAENEGIPVADLVARNAGFFSQLAERLNISNDDFIRTSVEERHIKGAQKLWQSCRPEDIYKKNYRGLYCVGCEEFKRERDLVDGRCEEHPDRELQVVEEENYFFKLSNYSHVLEELIRQGRILIIPETRRNEILRFIEDGLEDFSISRSRERAREWGIPVLGDDSQIMYVWFDALSNYINALGYADNSEKFKEFWQDEKAETIHVIGKGINRFHTIYWPAMLLSAGVRTPDKVLVHGYVTVGGQKISKSLGNTVDPLALIDEYGAESVRYYLLREIATGGDGDFSVEKFEARYNGDLANGLGNFASRVLKLAEKNQTFSGSLSEFEKTIVEVKERVAEKVEGFRLNEAIAYIWELVAAGDKYINDNKPWETKDGQVIGTAVAVLSEIAEILKPFLPETAGKIRGYIERKEAISEPLFPRLEVKME